MVRNMRLFSNSWTPGIILALLVIYAIAMTGYNTIYRGELYIFPMEKSDTKELLPINQNASDQESLDQKDNSAI